MTFLLFIDFFFFFKQKTAYEMRISDWSSDVCSSDLARQELGRRRLWPLRPARRRCGRFAGHASARIAQPAVGRHRAQLHLLSVARRRQPREQRHQLRLAVHAGRSEEHTSELQSLMRISYAVFRLKKKKYQTNNPTHHLNPLLH